MNSQLVARRGDRRHPRLCFTAVERRTGFDRRHTSAGTLLRSVRDNPAILFALLMAVNAMNVLDLLLTVGALRAGYATEGNLLMAQLLSQDVATAALFKFAVVGAVSAAIWAERRYRPVLRVAFIAAGGFVVILLVHGYGLFLYR